MVVLCQFKVNQCWSKKCKYKLCVCYFYWIFLVH